MVIFRLVPGSFLATITWLSVSVASMRTECRENVGFPASYELFSSEFQQPKPPIVQSEFKAHWKQHAWSPHFSHIASGYLYHSPSNQKVRVDATFDTNFASSLFDYGNRSSDGLVSNTMYTLQPSIAAQPHILHGYVKPSFPLFDKGTLQESRAVFGGVIDDRYVGTVASWNLMYQDSEPVTVYLNSGDVVVGYDFFDTSSRTGIATRYFNIDIGKIDGRVFDFPK